jgi:hypothetical protein
MAAPDISKLVAHYPTIIPMMGRDFNSHEFILKLADTHQRDYIEVLAEYKNKHGPFRILHGRLARALKLPQFKKLVEENHPKKVVSRNIFRQNQSCSYWRNLTKP